MIEKMMKTYGVEPKYQSISYGFSGEKIITTHKTKETAERRRNFYDFKSKKMRKPKLVIIFPEFTKDKAWDLLELTANFFCSTGNKIFDIRKIERGNSLINDFACFMNDLHSYLTDEQRQQVKIILEK